MDAKTHLSNTLPLTFSIINGFTVPLKPEHTEFLVTALLPLHKPKSIGLYHPQLSYCVTQFLEKDPGLTGLVFEKILRYWPHVNSTKELLFISELEDVRITSLSISFPTPQLSLSLSFFFFPIISAAVCL